MKYKYLILGGLVLLGITGLLAACGTATSTPCPTCPTPPPAPTLAPCPTAAPCPTCPTCPEPEVKDVPNEALWAGSGHADKTAMAFNDWNDTETKTVPATCAKCHSTTGYQDFLGADGSEAGKVDADAPIGTVVECAACHNSATQTLSSVTFPSGIEITGLGGEARCMNCHQGRASKVQVDAQIEKFAVTDFDIVVAPITDAQGNTSNFGFLNIHYFAAAATLYGNEVKGGYEYADKLYDAKHDHVAGYDTCIGCHDSHSLEVKVDECAVCHTDVASVEDLKNVREVSSLMDYDGDGDTEEGMFYEIQGLQEILYAQMQVYAKEKTGVGLVYDVAAYPYFFADADGDGVPDQNAEGASVRFTTWTVRLLKAAFNYQVSLKDPGAFAHGNKYIVQLLHDSIEDLGGDVSALVRDDAGHFAGNTMPFRDWDADGEVPYRCVKCHTAGGLPEFMKNGGTTVVSSNGTTLTTGVGAMEPSNGFQCTTCHDPAGEWPARYTVASVVFPSGKTVSYGGKDADGKFVADDANLCLLCHQGRESTASVNAALAGKDLDTVDSKISFKNIHYFAAGATIFGTEVKGAYEYDGKTYAGVNLHGPNDEAPINKCTDCHDVHKLEPKLESCAVCHGDSALEDIRYSTDTTDWDGDGDVTEGVAGEIATLSEALYAQIQAYASTTAQVGIVYDPATYPYFLLDADGDGKADVNDKGAFVGFNAFTPRLLKAAFNYQYSQKDPGAFVHNPMYVIQFLIDSIEDLGGDITGYTRP